MFLGQAVINRGTAIFFLPIQKKKPAYGPFHPSRDFIIPKNVQNKPQQVHQPLHGPM
jgi:hypothetical protein